MQKIINSFKNITNRTVLLIFSGFGLLGILKHEMWRDELEAWMIARDSLSIPHLFLNFRYEGHPPLWYLLLYFITRFTTQPIFMQLLHLLIAALAIWVFLKFSPFSKLQKILFTFGYFPFYEYAIKSRNYALGVLFLFIFCAFFPFRHKKYLFLFAVLFLVFQTSFFAAIVGLLLGALLLFELYSNKEILKSAKKWHILAGILLFLYGVGLLVSYAILPKDTFHPWSPHWFTRIDLSRVIYTIGHINDIYFACFVLRFPVSVLMYFILSIAELFFIFLIFLRKRSILFLYFIGTFGLLIPLYIKYYTGWYAGHLYILFIICLWLANYFSPEEPKYKFLKRPAIFAEKHLNIFLILMLSSQLIAGVMESVRDWFYQYSSGKETAQFIKENKLENMLMIGDDDYVASIISGYLNKKIYYPRRHEFGSFAAWNKKRINLIAREEVLGQAEKLMLQNQQSVLLILNYKLDPSEMPSHLKMIAQFTDHFDRPEVIGEVFYLYLLPYQ